MAGTLRRRTARLERLGGIGARQGLAMVEALAAATAWGGEADVTAIEVNGPAGERVRFDRMPGETLDALERRANPRGTWHARPLPLFREAP